MSETHALASYLVTNRLEDIPQDVRHEARRAVLNYLGCAVGGSPHTAVDRAIQALGPYSGKPTASVLGRAERHLGPCGVGGGAGRDPSCGVGGGAGGAHPVGRWLECSRS